MGCTATQLRFGHVVGVEAVCRILVGVNATLTIRQAYEAMRYFLDQYNEREPPERKESIAQLLRWTEIEGDGISYDPAQWHDWQAAVARAVGDSQPRSG